MLATRQPGTGAVPQGGRVPDFYLQYVQHIQQIIAEKARMEFSCLWAEKQRDPTRTTANTVPYWGSTWERSLLKVTRVRIVFGDFRVRVVVQDWGLVAAGVRPQDILLRNDGAAQHQDQWA